MTCTTKYYQVMHPTGGSFLGAFPGYNTLEQAVGDTVFQVKRAQEQGYNNDEKWLFIEVTTATITDDKGVFVSETTDKKAIGIYDNGKVTMY